MSGKFVTKTRLLTDTGGNVMPLAAVGLLVMAALVGGGVDMSRAYRVQSRLQAACDAGALAGRKAVDTNGFDDAVRQEANKYFAANFDETAEDARNPAFIPSSPDNGNTVVGNASAKMNTAVMKIFGFNEFDLSVECKASMGVGNSDITFVLDTTGSMAWIATADRVYPDRNANPPQTSRLEDLQTALYQFYDTVANATSGGNTRVRYAFVPYNYTVNVGALLKGLDPDFLADTHAYQSVQWMKWETTPDQVLTSGPTPKNLNTGNWVRTGSGTSQTTCLSNLPPNEADYSNNGSATSSNGTKYLNALTQKVVPKTVTQPQRKREYSCRISSGSYYINYRDLTRNLENKYNIVYDGTVITSPSNPWDDIVYTQVTRDVSQYKNSEAVSFLRKSSSGNSPQNASLTWGGCIEERQTISASDFLYDADSDSITPTGTRDDLDIDTPPDADDNTKWAPRIPELAYYRSAGTIASFSGTAVLGSNEVDACPLYSDTLKVMTEGAFNDYVGDLQADGNTYHDIGLLWGARLSSPQGIWQDTVNEEPSNGGTVSRHLIFMTDGQLMPSTTEYTSYGIERNDQRVTDDGSTNQYERHRSRFLAICEAIKAKGIRLWVVAFGSDFKSEAERALWNDSQNNLWRCASNNSAFAALDSSDLNEHFQTIAKQVGELRITQ